jgi:hypothetical protein
MPRSNSFSFSSPPLFSDTPSNSVMSISQIALKAGMRFVDIRYRIDHELVLDMAISMWGQLRTLSRSPDLDLLEETIECLEAAMLASDDNLQRVRARELIVRAQHPTSFRQLMCCWVMGERTSRWKTAVMNLLEYAERLRDEILD